MHSREERKTLEPYFNSNQMVEITGIFCENRDLVQHTLNEISLIYEPTNRVKKEMTQPIIKCTDNYAQRTIFNLSSSSCICEVRGTELFKDICEDHLWIQENLTGLKSGDKVCLSGVVKKYRDDKKRYGYDYYLDVCGIPRKVNGVR